MDNKQSKLWELLLENYDSKADLKADYDNIGAFRMVEGGCFSIAYDSQRLDLEDAGYIPMGSIGKYTNEEIFELYKEKVSETLETVFGY